MKFDSIDTETIPAKICRSLRTAIMKGQFKPGERLVQDEIAKAFNVSRMPIREAFKQLESEGYVTLEPHKGAVVKAFTIHELEEVYFLRSKFEPLAAEESLKHITKEKIDRLEQLINFMEKANVEEFIQYNIEFHKLLISDCKWEKLNSIIQNLWSGFPQQTPHLLPNQIATSKLEHTEMVNAIKQGNYKQASAILEHHIVRAGEDVLRNLRG